MRFILANSLTIARLLLGLAFPWLPSSWRLPLIVIGALSDLFDGALSRYFHATSQFGKVLDPIADKIFVLGVVSTLVMENRLALWQVGLIALRDIAVFIAGGLIMLWRGRKSLEEMSPTPVGKVTTALQFLFLITVMFTEEVNVWLFTLTAIVSGVAAIDYVRVMLAKSQTHLKQ